MSVNLKNVDNYLVQSIKVLILQTLKYAVKISALCCLLVVYLVIKLGERTDKAHGLGSTSNLESGMRYLFDPCSSFNISQQGNPETPQYNNKWFSPCFCLQRDSLYETLRQ